MHARRSQKELLEQAEAMSMDLQSTIDQMRRTEAARLALSREAHDLKLKARPPAGPSQATGAGLHVLRGSNRGRTMALTTATTVDSAAARVAHAVMQLTLSVAVTPAEILLPEPQQPQSRQ
jgi:hypothetical protein